MEIISGYSRKCRDSIAGVKRIWLFKYIKYNRSQIVINGNILISFPETIVYRFEDAIAPVITETQEQNEGGKYFNQSISLRFPSNNDFSVEILNDVDFRLMSLDNNGNYRVYGLFNGLQSNGVNYETGSAKNNLNGFTVTLTSFEEKESVFVENPFEIGFVEHGEVFRTTEDGSIRSLENNLLRTIE